MPSPRAQVPTLLRHHRHIYSISGLPASGEYRHVFVHTPDLRFIHAAPLVPRTSTSRHGTGGRLPSFLKSSGLPALDTIPVQTCASGARSAALSNPDWIFELPANRCVTFLFYLLDSHTSFSDASVCLHTPRAPPPRLSESSHAPRPPDAILCGALRLLSIFKSRFGSPASGGIGSCVNAVPPSSSSSCAPLARRHRVFNPRRVAPPEIPNLISRRPASGIFTLNFPLPRARCVFLHPLIPVTNILLRLFRRCAL